MSASTEQGNRPFIVACIPAYNEESTIASVILETEKHVSKVIVVNDGSTDHTAEIAKRIGALVISHERNMGYGAALVTGFKKALELGADIVITLDADGQHDPSYIPELLRPIIEGEADIVIGSRFLANSKVPKYREIGIKAITKLLNITTELKVTDAQSGFRAYSRRALERILPKLTERGMSLSLQILDVIVKNKLRVVEIPAVIKYDVDKPSTKNPLTHGLELVIMLIKNITERKPLLYLGAPGAISLGIGVLFGVHLLWKFNLTGKFSLLNALMVIGASLIGLLLVTTALILYTIRRVVHKCRSPAQVPDTRTTP